MHRNAHTGRTLADDIVDCLAKLETLWAMADGEDERQVFAQLHQGGLASVIIARRQIQEANQKQHSEKVAKSTFNSIRQPSNTERIQ